MSVLPISEVVNVIGEIVLIAIREKFLKICKQITTIALNVLKTIKALGKSDIIICRPLDPRHFHNFQFHDHHLHRPAPTPSERSTPSFDELTTAPADPVDSPDPVDDVRQVIETTELTLLNIVTNCRNFIKDDLAHAYLIISKYSIHAYDVLRRCEMIINKALEENENDLLADRLSILEDLCIQIERLRDSAYGRKIRLDFMRR